MTTAKAFSNPANQLEGLSLQGGWTVGPLEVRAANSTGGNFSTSYRLKNKDGRGAYLKALDLTTAFASGGDFTRVVQSVTEHFNFERDMLAFCEQKRMDRVVRAMDSGTIVVDNSPMGKVPYLIFEEADRDIRSQMDKPGQDSQLAWKLRSLHHISVGLKQLHGSDIAHQDVKPSNVFIFRAEAENRISKIGDLGRVSKIGLYSPFDVLEWPGDRHYAPPEIQFSFIHPDFNIRRIGADVYLLGSMISFLLTRTTAVASLFRSLPSQFLPGHWSGSFDDVLPHLQNAFAQTAGEFATQIPKSLELELLPIYRYLCEPDPRKRGYPGVPMNKISLERIVTRLDVIARKAEVGKYGVT